MPNSCPVVHLPENARFEITIADATAVLKYHLHGNLMTIYHTFVPIELRGHNIAAQLARAAFETARVKGFRIVPHCSYIARYAQRAPDAAKLIVVDED
jgi:predicted GNAT family acetyltransferase